MLQLEESIDSVSNDIRTFIVSQITTNYTKFPEVESSMYHDSEELVDIAHSLAISVRSVASIEKTRSAASTVRAFDPTASSDVPSMLNQENSSVPKHENYNEDRNDASLSVTGVPLPVQRRHDVDTWIQKTRTATNPSLYNDPSSVPSIASMPLTETSQPSICQYTPLGTINSQGGVEIELAKRRYKKAIDLMGKRKFREAIPHLTRTLETVNGTSEGPIFEDAPRREEIQIILATALTKNDPYCKEAEPILREVFDSPDSKPSEKFSAAHLLARLLLTLHPEDYAEAKSICLMAIKGRNATLGRNDPNTYESISLLVSICQISNDSDEEIWQDMLPHNYKLPPLEDPNDDWLPASYKSLDPPPGCRGCYAPGQPQAEVHFSHVTQQSR